MIHPHRLVVPVSAGRCAGRIAVALSLLFVALVAIAPAQDAEKTPEAASLERSLPLRTALYHDPTLDAPLRYIGKFRQGDGNGLGHRYSDYIWIRLGMNFPCSGRVKLPDPDGQTPHYRGHRHS